MSKCGKIVFPECEYFSTDGCISPFNCPYKIEHESITTATSTPLNSNVIYMDETYKDKEIARLTAENAELKARLEKAVILPMLQVVKGNRRPYELVYKDQNGRVIISKYRPYDKYEAEARLADLKEDRE